MRSFYGVPPSRRRPPSSSHQPSESARYVYLRTDWREWVEHWAQNAPPPSHDDDEYSGGAEPHLRDGYADAFLSRPLLHFLIRRHLRDVPDVRYDAEAYITFLQCFVADFLVVRCNGAGVATFFAQARALGTIGQRMTQAACPPEWFHTQDPNAPPLLAYNACRCLWEQMLPAVLALDGGRGKDDDDLRLHFDPHSMQFMLVYSNEAEDDDIEEQDRLLRSFRTLFS